ncbi:MAG: iron complex outermembrane receptor protein [Halieaceae bacterium]|jgi:iron complex outermembrane receptor protein
MMNTRQKFFKSFQVAALGGLALSLLAQTSAAQLMLEEVIVTAQKREQSLQDVPIAVAAYSGAMLEESGIGDVFDLQSNSPGLMVDQNQNATTSNFSIRGIGTGGNNFGQESSVGLYVDGIYRSRPSAMVSQLVDISAVEVLRGPQGTLFGRNAMSGAVHFKSEKPDHEGTAFIQAQTGNYGLLGLSGAASFSAIEDVLAFRVTGFSTERDGWIDNLTTPGDDEIFDKDRWGWRLQALYTPNDNLTVQIIIDDSELDEVCCGFTVLKDNLDIDQRNASGMGSDAILEPRGGTFIPESAVFDNEVALNYNPISRGDDSGASIKIDYDLEDYTITSLSGWRDFTSYDFIDADFTDLQALTDENLAEQTSFSQELRITYTGDKLNYVAGAFYFTQKLDSVSTLSFDKDTEAFAFVFSALGTAGAIAFDQPLTSLVFGSTFFPIGGNASDLNKQRHESWAVFGQFDYALTDAWTLTAGLRYSDEDKELSTKYTESDATSFGFLTDLFPPTSQRPDVDEHIVDDQITGTIKLSWFATDDMMLYASYGTGYKAGGTNTDRIDPAFEQVFTAETADSYELGMKAEFPDQAMRLNVSLYISDIDDFQVGTFTGEGFNLQNAATVNTWGGEIELLWQASENLTVTAGYAKNVADFDEFERGNCWVATPFHFGTPDPGAQILEADGTTRPAAGIDEQLNPDFCDRSGGRIGTNPEDFLALSGRYDFMVSNEISGFFLAEYSYTGDMMLAQSNEPLTLQGSYELVNLRAGLVFESYNLSITAWGRNVFDEEYNGTAYPGVLQEGKLGAYRREPATYGVTARMDF